MSFRSRRRLRATLLVDPGRSKQVARLRCFRCKRDYCFSSKAGVPLYLGAAKLAERLNGCSGKIPPTMSHGGDPDPAELADKSLADVVAEQMQALAAPSRLRILGALHQEPRSVGDLSKAISMEPSAVSHQLRVLRHLGLVVGDREGRRVIYRLHDEHIGLLLNEAIAHVDHLRLGLTSERPAQSLARA